MYAAFVLDAASREIVGWQVSNHLRASLARDALDMALSARLRSGQDVSGLIHHSDRGVQYRSVTYGKSLADSKVVASVGSGRGIGARLCRSAGARGTLDLLTPPDGRPFPIEHPRCTVHACVLIGRCASGACLARCCTGMVTCSRRARSRTCGKDAF